MARDSKPHSAPIQLTQPLTVTLSGHMLERLNEYREAVYRLSAEGWPYNTKAHTGPDSNREHYRPQRADAADSLLNFLIDEANAQQRLTVAITPLEQTLIDNARSHQEALAAHYPKYQAGQYTEDDHEEYLKHSGALTDLVSLAHRRSGLSNEAAEQLRQIEDEDISTFRLHVPVEIPPQRVDFRLQDERAESVDVSRVERVLVLGGSASKV